MRRPSPYWATCSHACTESGNELLCALYGVRLCAPDYVIEVAEELGRSVPHVGLGKDEFERANQTFVQAQTAFLEAARHDLDYNPKWWQPWKKWKGRTFHARRDRAT
ncbi:hypothetical protein [Streptomyces spiramyceticus]|uniref:hypothetical protein n=1 Tax=Streptomyces spiramyceticus TaxID=299717 RepID=UPI00237A55AF|nr:hypothetical protein [Streptomyces spiramyceticus]